MQTTGLKGAHLSLQQRRLWALQPASQNYRCQCAAWLNGALVWTTFLRAWQDLVDQHEILHTVFQILPGMDVPLQIIAPPTPVTCPVICLQNIDLSLWDTSLDTHFASLFAEPFDLAHGPLMRMILFRLTPEKHLLVLSFSALCADTSTLACIISEFCRTYDAIQKEQAQVTEEEPLQYIDVASWQDSLLTLESARTQRDFWLKKDLSQLDLTSIPLEQERAGEANRENVPLHSSDIYKACVHITPSLYQRLEQLAQSCNVSLASIFLTCWEVFLWRLMENPRLVIGVACNGHNIAELERSPGLYTRFVPLENPCEKTGTFASIVRLFDQALNEAIERHAYFTWPDEENHSNPYPKIFPFAFEFERWSIAGGSLDVALMRHFGCIEPFALKLSVLQEHEHCIVELQSDQRRLAPAQLAHLAAMLETLLAGVAENLSAPLSALPLLTLEEQRKTINTFRAPTVPLNAQAIHQIFEAQAAQYPEQLALLSTREQLTYRELNARANQLAHWLRHRGIGPDTLVALCMPRSVQMIVGLLGILKAGAAYVPFDPESPSIRLSYQLQDSQPALLLAMQTLQSRMPEWSGQTFYLDAIQQELEQEPIFDLLWSGSMHDLAYIIYTSGSTGTPKGVMIQHSSLVNYTQALCQHIALEPGLHFATVSTLAADLGNTAIFCALATGGCLHILDYETVTSGSAFAHWLTKHPIDVLKIVPSHLSALLADTEMPLPRRALIMGGEALPPNLIQRLSQAGLQGKIINHYGPTETTIGVLVNIVAHQECCQEASSIPLGRPLANTEVYILDSSLQLTPPGIPGELCIGGMGVATGYLNQPALTAEYFVPHPFSSQPGKRLYRTGDLVKCTPQDQIAFLGRKDNQVKIRGYRVELTEIEIALKQHPEVWDGLVTLHEDETGEKSLVGYVVPFDQSAATQENLRAFLRQRLPEYMVPATFVYMKNLPLTINGKVDRKHLPGPGRHSEHAQTIASRPLSPVEDALAQIWQDLLKLPSIDIHDNFFQLGGHSLLATQVIARVRAILQVELSITSLFETPTIAALARRVEHALRQERDVNYPPLQPVARTQAVPLSFAQQRLWLLDQLEPGNIAYLLLNASSFYGPLNIKALEHSFAAVICRHEILRTVFRTYDEQPAQVVQEPGAFRIPVIDLQDLSEQGRQIAAQHLAAQEALQPCDLERGPLLRVTFLRLARREHILLWTLHHLISDGWSNEILARELSLFYRAAEKGERASLPDLPIQYADYTLWQRQWLQGAYLDQQLEYWRQQLANVPVLNLPTDRPRPPQLSQRGALQTLALPPDLQQGLRQLAQQAQVTLFMVLLAAFQVLLARWSGQKDIAVGTPIANRTREEVEGLIGFFVNTLVLRTDLSGNPGFLDLLQRVREVTLGAYAHQDLPFEQVVEALQPERDRGRSPLFQVMFNLQHIGEATTGTTKGERIRTQEMSTAVQTAKFDLTLAVLTNSQEMQCGLEYATDLFSDEQMEILLQNWQTLLQSIVAQPQTSIWRLPLLSHAQREQLLVHWNATSVAYPTDTRLHLLIEEQAKRTPEAVAVVFEDSCLTYQKLDLWANRLAHRLGQLGIGPDILVGVCMERSLEMVIGLLATLKAGGAYVPLDPAYPMARLAAILDEVQVPVLLTQQSLLSSLPEFGGITCCLDQNQEDLAQLPNILPRQTVTTHHLAYVIYTSGSTGKPKGAMNTHNAICNRLLWAQQHYQLGQQDRVLQKTPLSFDVSVWEFFWPLLTGACLVLARQAGQRDPLYLLETIRQQQISTVHFVPSMLQTFLQTEGVEHCNSLRRVICSGEALSARLQTRFFERLQAELYNLYGPTEAAIEVTYWECQRGSSEQRVPIGKPIANVEIYVLDQQLQAVPVGVPGELYIGGAGLARGYWQRPDLTAERFIPHPFSQKAGQRLYKTGDTACYRKDGAIEYLRRNDDQVKIRGHRIELGEIETVLERHPAVQECVVLVREDPPADKRLVAYVVTMPAQAITVSGAELRSYLQMWLPDIMLPEAFVLLEKLPLTPNGKIDRRALPTPDRSRTSLDVAFVASQTPVQELLARLWQEILKLETVGIHDDFFALGGHSLLAVQLLARVQRVYQVNLPLRSVFDHPTIAQFAQQIQQAMYTGPELISPPLLPAERTQEIPLAFAQQRLWFLDQLQPDNTAYLIQNLWHLAGELHTKALEHSFSMLIQRHEVLRTTFEAHDGKPVQVIHPPTAFSLPLIDLSGLQRQRRPDEVQKLAGHDHQQPCNLVQGPLVRAAMLRLQTTEHFLMATIHHIIFDGWSENIFIREITALYQAEVQGEQAALPALPIQYADYALWQRQWLQGNILEAHLDYWTHQLGGIAETRLPLDHPRPAQQSYRGASRFFHLPPQLSLPLLSLCREEAVTPFMLLLASFQVLLSRYSGQEEIVVGTDSANRSLLETEHLIGFFVNLLVLRTNLHGRPTFRQVLQRVREMLLGAYSHQELPFDLLVEKLLTDHPLDRNPLVQVLFVQQNLPGDSRSAPATSEPDQAEDQDPPETTRASKFDLAVFVQERAGTISGVLTYRVELFEPATIRRLLERWQVLLGSLLENPDTEISQLAFLSPREQQQQEAEENMLRSILHTREKEWFDLLT